MFDPDISRFDLRDRLAAIEPLFASEFVHDNGETAALALHRLDRNLSADLTAGTWITGWFTDGTFAFRCFASMDHALNDVVTISETFAETCSDTVKFSESRAEQEAYGCEEAHWRSISARFSSLSLFAMSLALEPQEGDASSADDRRLRAVLNTVSPTA